VKSRTFACSIAFHFDPPLSILLIALLLAAPMARQQAGYMRMCGTDPFRACFKKAVDSKHCRYWGKARRLRWLVPCPVTIGGRTVAVPGPPPHSGGFVQLTFGLSAGQRKRSAQG
jgi:hypothetical protein